MSWTDVASFSKKWASPEQAMDRIKDGSTIVTAMAASEPQIFYNSPFEAFDKLKNLTVFCANPSGLYPIYCDLRFDDFIEIRPMFLTATVARQALRKNVHYVPCHLSQWTANILNTQEIDVFWGSCSLPDQHGYVSLGPNNCYEYETLRMATSVILELNPNIPFTFGMTCVPEHRVDVFLYSEKVLPIYQNEAPDSTDHQIAALVADLVLDEATLQFGIGSIPNALTQVLREKKNLGVHTEMINDSILELIEAGAVTGGAKTIWPEKIIGSFAYGSEKLYQFINHNPMVELHPSSVVNDPFRIGRNHNMVSINSAVEIDITGQVCSESLGHQEVSGIGGATDTHVGAQRSNAGRGIIALRSTTRKGQAKIVSELKPGAKVSVSRNDVDTIVTEYGVARLKGKTVADRARSLIDIAHPKDREGLLFDAKKFGYI